MEINAKLFKIAYKKLKSSLYYDKTQTILRDKLVNFESICTNIDRYLEELSDKFLSEDTRGEMFEKILSSISFHAFPKKILPEQSVMIKNYAQKNIGIVDNQYFIDMDICGHILGVLWLLLIGYKVDENMYEHSYGNRIRKNLYNEFSADPTYSPYLFEPYFQQYEGWRDTAMNEAMQHLHAGQDVVILTLDFKRFYYSVDVTETLFQEMYNDVMDEFDQIIGLQKIGVIHLNDSKNVKGAHKDRHANLGLGEIGFDILNGIAHNERIKDVPKILETPYIDGKAPYKEEIDMLKNQEFRNIE